MLLISRQNKPPSHLVADQLGGVVVRGDEVRPHRLPHRSRVFRLSCRLHTPKKTTQQTRLNHPSTPPPPKKKKTPPNNPHNTPDRDRSPEPFMPPNCTPCWRARPALELTSATCNQRDGRIDWGGGAKRRAICGGGCDGGWVRVGEGGPGRPSRRRPRPRRPHSAHGTSSRPSQQRRRGASAPLGPRSAAVRR